MNMTYVGIDLAGVETRPTGFCILDRNLKASTSIVYGDREIVGSVLEAKPEIVAIDAPLALPIGRESLEKRNDIHFRECDKKLLEMGIKFFPITLGPMRKLTERGIRLKGILERKGFEVIETYPGAAQDILNISRKKDLGKLEQGLKKIGIKGLDKKTGDELDAATCALVGKMYVEGKYLAIGDEREVLMILPAKNITQTKTK